MPSPFPGMNPYLEHPSVWDDFHERWIPRVADALGVQVRPRYIVKIDERLYVHENGSENRRLLVRGDVAISGRQTAANVAGSMVLEAPIEVEVPQIDVESISYLEIRDRDTRDLITVIELLSPTNKYSGPDRDQYLGKSRTLLQSGAHLVEIDLLRGGPRMPWRNMPACDYCVVVSRSERRPRAELWPIRLRQPLPPIPIPLRTGDADAKLDLQFLVHQIHDAAGYEDYIYGSDPEPPISREEAEWARQLVQRQASDTGA